MDNGFDSDNELGPFLADGVEVEEEIGMEEEEVVVQNGEDEAGDGAQNVNPESVVSPDEVHGLKVAELRKMLKDRGLAQNGLKEALKIDLLMLWRGDCLFCLI